MREYQSVPVTEKLKRILEEKGISMMTASKQIGYSQNYISNAIMYDRKISKSASIALEHFFGIKPEDYAPEEPQEEPPEEPQEEPQTADDEQRYFDRMALVIYASVKKAVIDAMNS